MKKTLLTLSLLMTVMVVMAVPTKPGMWQTIRLANGIEVRVVSVGDEHGSWLKAADGTCYVQNADGNYEVADAQQLQASRAARQAQHQSKRRAIYASTSDGLGKKGTMSRGSVPSIGNYTIPVVMVQFPDVKFQSTTTVEYMKRFYNEENFSDLSMVGSVRDYFKAQSGGQFVPTFDVVGIVTLSKNHTYYGKDTGSGNNQQIDVNIDELPGDVIEAAISQLGTDFSQYVVPAGDEYHNSGVPLLAMLYAGKGEATEQQTSANNNWIWPCEWDAEEDTKGGTYSGVHFNSFFVGNELYSGGTQLMGPGTFCHEFGHALGLPDFYVTDYSYESDDPFGNWSIMDTGGYVGDAYTPIGYNAYEKSYMGWLDLPEIGTASEVTLQSPFGTAENSAYIVRNSSTESFIFENRQPGTWYPDEYGSGVLVTRINYSYNSWSKNDLNNTQSKKRACVLTANGAKLDYNASSAHLYGNGKNAIASLKTYSGTQKTIGIKTVTKNTDGTVTLSLSESSDPGTDPDPIVVPEGGVLFYESFNQCDGTGGNDKKFSGSGVASSKFSSDNDGWEYGAAYGAKQCARFGSGSSKGTVTTPLITLTGNCVLTFKAAAWGSDGKTLKFSAEGADVTFSPSQVTMSSGQWTEHTIQLTGSGTAQIVFTPSKRFFLDEVKVQDPNATTAIQTVRPVAAKAAVYTLDGRFVGTDITTLPHGLYIVNGRKVVK